MSDELTDLKRKRLKFFLKPMGAVERNTPVMDAGDYSSLDLTGTIFFTGVGWYPQEINCLWAHLLLRMDPLPRYERFSINDLGNIEFNKHPVYSSSRLIRTPLVLLYAGAYEYNYQSTANQEFSNEIWFLEFFDARQSRGEPVWVYVEDKRYPSIRSLVQARFRDRTCKLVRPPAAKPSGGDPAANIYKKSAGGRI